MENLKDLVIKYHKDLKTYTEIFNRKAGRDRDITLQTLKEKFAETPEEVNLAEAAKEILFKNGFHQSDIRHLQEKFMTAYEVYERLKTEESEELPEEEKTVYKYLKQALPKQIFTVEKDTFVELEEGYFEEITKKYENQKLFSMLEDQIKKLLNE